MQLALSMVFILGLTQNKLQAQEIWSLQQCITHAIDNSLQIEGSEIALQNAEITRKIALQSRIPNLNGGTNVGWNFGRTIDPTRNEFINETFFNNGFQLSSNMLLYNGGRINNTIAQSKVDAQATKFDLEQMKNDISLNVATVYLNILFAKENLVNAGNQLGLTQAQISQLEKLIAVGDRPENDRLDLLAQLAQNEQTQVEARNSLTISFLNLKQILRLDPDYAMDIEVTQDIKLFTDPTVMTFDEVYSSALGTQPSINAGKLKVRSAVFQEKIANSALYPTLGFNMNGRSNYSNRGVSLAGFNINQVNQSVLINGEQSIISTFQPSPILADTPYGNQVRDNLSYGFGFSLNVPIYNNYINKGNVQRAKLGIKNANITLDQTKETLKITVGQALADARAAKARLDASTKTLNAQNNQYDNALKRFDVGSLNSFDLTRLKTQLETSTVNNLIAKYDFIFRTKVLDFYLGKPLVL